MTQKDRQYEQLTAYLDGELGEAQRAEVERLLERDAEARRILNELRAMARMVGGLPRAPAPRGLSAEISARLEREALLGDSPDPFQAASQRTMPIWQRGLAIAAALAIIVTGSWLMWPELPKPPSERPVITVAEAESPRADSSTPADEAPARLLREDRVTLAAKPQSVPAEPGAMAEPMSLRQGGRMNEPKGESAPAGVATRLEFDDAAQGEPKRDADLVEESQSQFSAAAEVATLADTRSQGMGGVQTEAAANRQEDKFAMAGLPEDANGNPDRSTRARWHYSPPADAKETVKGAQSSVHRLDIQLDSPARNKIVEEMKRGLPEDATSKDEGVSFFRMSETAASAVGSKLKPIKIKEGEGLTVCIFDVGEEGVETLLDILKLLAEQETDFIEEDESTAPTEPMALTDTDLDTVLESQSGDEAKSALVVVTIRPITVAHSTTRPVTSQPATQPSSEKLP